MMSDMVIWSPLCFHLVYHYVVHVETKVAGRTLTAKSSAVSQRIGTGLFPPGNYHFQSIIHFLCISLLGLLYIYRYGTFQKA